MNTEQQQRLDRLQKRADNRHSSVRPPEWADIDFLLSIVKEALPICPDCQQGYVCEHCGKPIGDYYADIKELESLSIQEQKS